VGINTLLRNFARTFYVTVKRQRSIKKMGLWGSFYLKRPLGHEAANVVDERPLGLSSYIEGYNAMACVM
jgi:hypothetical protein